MAKFKPKRPGVDCMRRAVERARPGYGVKLAKEAADWPSRLLETKTLIRRRIGADFDALPGRLRAAAWREEEALTKQSQEIDDED